MLDSPDSRQKVAGTFPAKVPATFYVARRSSLHGAVRKRGTCTSQFGHKADLFQNSAFKTMFLNAIRWASER